MINDTWIANTINETLVRENEEERANHEPSGKLIASMLYMPLRVQLLKHLKVPGKPMEAYVLGKFKRGKDVEDWYVGQLDKAGVLLEKQKKVEYRGAIGFIDAVVNSDKMYFKQGVMPHEVKSVTNMKLKRIDQTKEVDYHYKLQGCFYGIATERPYYAIDIVSAEDLRPNVYVFETKELQPDIDKIISDYDQAVKDWEEKHILPPFVANPNVKWTEKVEYLPFEPFWVEASDTEVIAKLKELKLI